MAILHPNALIGSLTGKLGDLVLARRADGKVIVRHRPTGTAHSTPGERQGQASLSRANQYVQRLKADPGAYALYQRAARIKGKRACDLAKADYAHPPIICDIDLALYNGQSGQTIWVQAADDFEVESVQLTLAGLDGTPIEDGQAVLDLTRGWWRYISQVQAPASQVLVIHAAASDYAGNQVLKTVCHALIISG